MSRLSYHQPALDHALLRLEIARLDFMQEYFGGSRTDIVRRVIDAAQRGLYKTANIFIVESEHGNVFRYPETVLLDHVHHFDGSVIIDRKDRVRAIREIDQVPRVFFNMTSPKMGWYDIIFLDRVVMFFQGIDVSS